MASLQASWLAVVRRRQQALRRCECASLPTAALPPPGLPADASVGLDNLPPEAVTTFILRTAFGRWGLRTRGHCATLCAAGRFSWRAAAPAQQLLLRAALPAAACASHHRTAATVQLPPFLWCRHSVGGALHFVGVPQRHQVTAGEAAATAVQQAPRIAALLQPGAAPLAWPRGAPLQASGRPWESRACAHSSRHMSMHQLWRILPLAVLLNSSACFDRCENHASRDSQIQLCSAWCLAWACNQPPSPPLPPRTAHCSPAGSCRRRVQDGPGMALQASQGSGACAKGGKPACSGVCSCMQHACRRRHRWQPQGAV